jgi:hypothetical protein
VPSGFSNNGQLWGVEAREDLPIIFMSIVVLLLASDVLRGRIRWYRVAWLIVAIVAFVNIPPWALEPLRKPLPNWFWQIALLPPGMWLAAGPLVRSVRRGRQVAIESISNDSVRGHVLTLDGQSG